MTCTARRGTGRAACTAGTGPAALGAPLHPGPVLSATFQLGLPGEPTPADFYGRAGNPTWRALEAAIGELDGGECVVFASGMAAIARRARAGRGRRGAGAAVRRLLPGPGARAGELAPLGVAVREVPTAGTGWPACSTGRRWCCWRPRPTPAWTSATSPRSPPPRTRAGALLAVDNTTATPLGQRPLELGADLVVASDTKALAGHGDVVLGHVSTADPALAAAAARGPHPRAGAVPGPMEAWLAHRGLGTLDLRLARQAANAAALVEVLLAHPAVDRRARGPAIPAIRRTSSLARQMRRWNGVLRFTLAVRSRGGPVPRRVPARRLGHQLRRAAQSADRRERWGDAVPPGLLRLSAGCEDADDLVADLRAASGHACR